MKLSTKLRALAALSLLAGVALAAGWLLVSAALGIELRMNGPWLIAVLVLLAGSSFALASVFAEARERAVEHVGR